MTILAGNKYVLKTDNYRHYKHKTDMCRNGSKCPFLSSGCIFAHSPQELRIISLDEREQVGLIPDASSFRTLPCFSFTCTGGCRYHKKCTFLHDPRTVCTSMRHSGLPTVYRKNKSNLHNASTIDSVMCWPAMQRDKVVKNLDLFKLPTTDQVYVPTSTNTNRFNQSWEIFARVCSNNGAEQVKTKRLPVFEQMTKGR